MRIKPAGAFGFTAAVGLILGAISIGAQDGATGGSSDDPVIAQLHAQSVKFLDGISAGEIETAYGEFLKNSQLGKQTAAVNGLIDKTRGLTKYGEFRAHERIDVRRIGADLVLLKYLYKCDDFPVVWYFTYYRDFRHEPTTDGAEHWVIVAVRFDSELELLGL